MCERSVASDDLAACDRMPELSGGAGPAPSSGKSRFQQAGPSAAASGGTNTRQEHRNYWPLLSSDLNAAHSYSCAGRTRMFLLCDNSGSTCVTSNKSKTNSSNNDHDEQHGDNAHESVVVLRSLTVERRELARDGNEVSHSLLDKSGSGAHHNQINEKIRTLRRLASDGEGRGESSEQQQVRVAPAGGCGQSCSRSSQARDWDTSKWEMSNVENCRLPSSASSAATRASNQMPSFQEVASFKRPNSKIMRPEMFLGRRPSAGSSGSSSDAYRRRRPPTRAGHLNAKLLFLDFTTPTFALLVLACALAPPVGASVTGHPDAERVGALPPFAPIRRSAALRALYGASGAPATGGRGFGPQADSALEHEAAGSMSSPKFTRTNELEAFLDEMNHKELQTVASGRPIEDLFQPKPLAESPSDRRPQMDLVASGEHSTAESAANQLADGQGRLDRSLKPSGGGGLVGSQSEQQIYSDCALILQRTYVKNMEDSKHQLVPFGKTEQACISYRHIDKAIEQAKHKLKFKEFVKMRKQTAAGPSSPAETAPPPPPLDVLHTSLEPPEDLVAAIGEINMAATQIIAEQFDLSNDELLNGLPLIDMSKTKFAAICPLLVRRDLKCEVTRFRSFTGHCNNLKHPTWGAAKTPYARYLPPVHPDGIWAPRKSIVSEVSFELGVGHRETHTEFAPSMRLQSVHQDNHAHHGLHHFPATSAAAELAFTGNERQHHHRMGSSRPMSAGSLSDEPSISELESQADAEMMRETRHANQLDTAASVSFASHVQPDQAANRLMEAGAAPLVDRVLFVDHLQGSATPSHQHQHQHQLAAFNEAAAAAARAHHMEPLAAGHEHPALGSLALQSAPMLHQGQGTRSVPQELPSARLVSSLVHRDADVPHHEFSMLFQSWGQLLDHDMTRAAAPPQTIKCCPSAPGQPPGKHKLCLPIKVPANDPFYSKFNVQCLEFRRTLASVRPNCVLGPRVHQNANTAPIDANFVYGSAQATADSLRLFKGGRLRDRDWFRAEGLKPLLPAQEIEPDLNCLGRPRDLFCFLGGDVRVNEQTHLTVLHTLYMREHNRIADKLSELNPHWDDERTFQETRHLVAATVQHVLVNEYIPLLIGRKMAELYNLTVSTPNEFGHNGRGLYWHGYDPTVTTSVANSFAAAAFRQGHTFVQSTIDRFNKFHEFLSSEKLRHLFMQPFLLYQPGVMDELISGMINRQSQSYDPFMTVELAGHLFQPPEAEFGLDLAAINVQRGRDQGLPGYNLFREWCGLPRAESFEQLEPYLTNRTAFLYSKLYKHVDDIDLWSAGVSERKLPGAAIGPTFSCIIARQFSNTRRGDRFWYENPNLPSSFTADQLNEIKKFTLAKLICHNADDLPTIQRWAFRVAHPVLNPRVECSQLPEIDLQYWQEV